MCLAECYQVPKALHAVLNDVPLMAGLQPVNVPVGLHALAAVPLSPQAPAIAAAIRAAHRPSIVFSVARGEADSYDLRRFS